MSVLSIPGEEAVLAKLTAWGNARPSIRAMLLSSSRARPEGSVDLLSDYDLILAVTDPDRYGQKKDWLSDYGPVMVYWGDQSTEYGLTTYFHGVVYADYVKIDYSVWPDALLERIAAADTLPDELDAGYRVLLDKDGRTAGWKPPSYRAFIPAPPTEAEYRALVEEGWWTSTYVAKSLWRDEFVFARWVLDNDIKCNTMRRMLEWRFEIDVNWSVRPGVLGRDLKRRLPADIWSALTDTYVGPDIEDNWAALFRTMALFGRVSREVGDVLGYVYPQQVDDQVSAFLKAVQQLPPGGAPPPSEDADRP
jgi:aminoglycoside 6-adenylyltransferase